MKTYKMWSEETKQHETISFYEVCVMAAKKTKLLVKKNTTLEDRKNILIEQLRIHFSLCDSFVIIENAGIRTAAGASFSVISQKNRIIINYRCGYGKYNYAPSLYVSEK